MADSPRDPRLGRRLLVVQVAGIGAALATAGAAEAATRQPAPQAGDVPQPVVPVVTDSDPSDSPGYGRGRPYRRTTDSDPYDAAGAGRGGYYAPPPRRSVTDSDPYDAAGGGRGYYAPPRRRSVTDSDPYDAAGRGRGY